VVIHNNDCVPTKLRGSHGAESSCGGAESVRSAAIRQIGPRYNAEHHARNELLTASVSLLFPSPYLGLRIWTMRPLSNIANTHILDNCFGNDWSCVQGSVKHIGICSLPP
jgi:hypothetical protein